MRKAVLFSALLLSPLIACADGKDKPADLTGNWKETRRMTKDKTEVAYTDTIRIDFQTGNEFLWQKAGSFMFKGTYKATSTSLDLGSRYFTVVESSRESMLLKDDDGFYQLTRYKKQAAAEDNSNAGSKDRGNTESSGDIDIQSFNGNWETYKRTSKVQQKAIDYERIPKKLDLKIKKSVLTGVLHPAQELEGRIDWRVDKYENGYIFFKGKDDRKMKVLKCKDNEMILEEGDYTYFLKKFS